MTMKFARMFQWNTAQNPPGDVSKKAERKKVFDKLTRSAKLCKALPEGVFQSLSRSLCLIVRGEFGWRQGHIANDFRQ